MSAPLYSLFPPSPQGNSPEETDTVFLPEHTLNIRGVHLPETEPQGERKDCPFPHFGGVGGK